MPKIREYNPQLGAISRPLSQAADPGMAARAGDAGKALGAALSEISRAAFSIAEQNDATNLQVDLAQARADFTAKMQRARETGEASDPEYVKSVQSEAQDYAAKLAEKMQTRSGANAARAYGAQFATGMHAAAIQENALAAGEAAKRRAQVALDTNRNTLRDDPSQFAAILEESNAQLDGPAFAHLDAEKREAVKREVSSGLAFSAIEGVIYTRSPQEAMDILASGKVDHLLTADQKRVLYREAESTATAVKSRANLDALMALDGRAENGQLTKAAVLEAYDKKIFSTPSQALDFYHRSQRRAKEIERERLLSVGIELGDPVAIADYTPKEQEEGFGKFSGRLMEAAGDDDALRADATNRIITRGRELGLMSPRLRSLIETASPARPAQFEQAHKWYESLNAVDPVYASKHVSPNQAALFSVYSAAKNGGLAPAAAIELVRQAGDPKKMQEFKKEMPPRVLADIEGALNPYFGSPASNATWAKNAVAEMAKMRMAFGDANVEDAVEWAQAQFNARHALVGGRWLPTQDTASPDVGPALDEYLKRVPNALKKDGATQDDLDPNGYELRVDRQTKLDGSMQVYEKSSGMPVPGRRVAPREAVRAYSKIKETLAISETSVAAAKEKSRLEMEKLLADQPGGVLVK